MENPKRRWQAGRSALVAKRIGHTSRFGSIATDGTSVGSMIRRKLLES
jgi:hypothetical protein